MKKIISIFTLLVLSLILLAMPDVNVNAAVAPISSITDGGTYYIRNQRSGLYLDVNNASTENHTHVLQYFYHGKKKSAV